MGSVTKPRAPRIVAIEEAATESSAPVIVPTTVSDAVPSAIAPLPESPAAAILADEVQNSAPIVVPAPVQKPTAAQLAANEMHTDMRVAFSLCYGRRPNAVNGVWVEPDKAMLKSMRTEYAAANELDLTDEDDLIAAALAVKENIDTQRAAFAAAAADQGAVDREWLIASQKRISELLSAVNFMLSAAGGKVSKKALDAPSTSVKQDRKPRTTLNWQEIAPKLHDAAQRLMLDGVYFVDQTAGGYKGAFHVLKLHRDGRFEKCRYNADSHVPTPTGEFVSTWKYFDVDGVDITSSEQKKPAHALSKDEMYGILLIRNGKIVDLPGLSHALYDAAGQRKLGTVRHYALPTVFWAEAGLNFGK